MRLVSSLALRILTVSENWTTVRWWCAEENGIRFGGVECQSESMIQAEYRASQCYERVSSGTDVWQHCNLVMYSL